MKKYDNLLESLRELEKDFVKGWDFSKVNSSILNEEKSWNYEAFVDSYLREGAKILDMGTGGGEFVMTLDHPRDLITVTEEHIPNYNLCLERLVPLGIDVHKVYKDDLLPLEDGLFDLIINRHSPFLPEEVFRTLKPGGYFITQQVGNKNNAELVLKMTGKEKDVKEHLSFNEQVNGLKEYDFEILVAIENFLNVKFCDMSAVMFYGKSIVWDFPDFCADKYIEHLANCQKEVEENGYVSSTEHRYLILARKK